MHNLLWLILVVRLVGVEKCVNNLFLLLLHREQNRHHQYAFKLTRKFEEPSTVQNKIKTFQLSETPWNEKDWKIEIVNYVCGKDIFPKTCGISYELHERIIIKFRNVGWTFEWNFPLILQIPVRQQRRSPSKTTTNQISFDIENPFKYPYCRRSSHRSSSRLRTPNFLLSGTEYLQVHLKY